MRVRYRLGQLLVSRHSACGIAVSAMDAVGLDQLAGSLRGSLGSAAGICCCSTSRRYCAERCALAVAEVFPGRAVGALLLRRCWLRAAQSFALQLQ